MWQTAFPGSTSSTLLPMCREKVTFSSTLYKEDVHRSGYRLLLTSRQGKPRLSASACCRCGGAPRSLGRQVPRASGRRNLQKCGPVTLDGPQKLFPTLDGDEFPPGGLARFLEGIQLGSEFVEGDEASGGHVLE